VVAVTDVGRASFVIAAAVIWPLAVPSLARRRFLRAALAVVWAAWALTPLMPRWECWPVLALVFTGVALVPEENPAELPLGGLKRPFYLAAAGLLTAVALGLLFADHATGDELLHLIRDDDRVAVGASGLLVAIFAAGPVVAGVLGALRLAEGHEGRAGLPSAGSIIGWLERALVFGLLLGGSPEAAGLVVTAKSVARFPELSQDQNSFAEYFLVGTLVSIGFAAAVALGVRVALGLPPL
jgi:hypothetical protein